MKQAPAPSYGERAAACFQRGYNCAQATAAVFAEDFAFDRELLLKLTAGFGGGLGGLRQTCGAVSAMALVAGLHAGAYAPDDHARKTALYELIRRLRDEFVAAHGSDCCRVLLERAGIAPVATPSERTADYYARRPCPALVASAAEILARTLYG